MYWCRARKHKFTICLINIYGLNNDFSWACLVSGLLSFEHPSVLLFLLPRIFYKAMPLTIEKITQPILSVVILSPDLDCYNYNTINNPKSRDVVLNLMMFW